jgi:hypothetical protein
LEVEVIDDPSFDLASYKILPRTITR